MVNHQDEKTSNHMFSVWQYAISLLKTLFMGHILDFCSRIWNVAGENLFALKCIITTLGLVRLPGPVVGRGLTTLEPGAMYLKLTT